MRRKRMKSHKEREEFITNPFQYTSKLLGKPRTGTLKSTKEEIKQHLQQIHSDPQRKTTQQSNKRRPTT